MTKIDLKRFRFDIDGVLKRLDLCALGRDAESWGDTEGGKNIIHHVDDDLDIILRAKPSEYLRVIDNLYCDGGTPLRILTSQRPHYREYSEEWLQEHLSCEFEVKYSAGINTKLKHLEPGEYLFDDYPGFTSYNRIIIVDRKYNRHVLAKYRVRNPDDLIACMEGLSV